MAVVTWVANALEGQSLEHEKKAMGTNEDTSQDMNTPIHYIQSVA
jgi:hypothetical protein